jgi:hypothetical protein
MLDGACSGTQSTREQLSSHLGNPCPRAPYTAREVGPRGASKSVWGGHSDSSIYGARSSPPLGGPRRERATLQASLASSPSVQLIDFHISRRGSLLSSPRLLVFLHPLPACQRPNMADCRYRGTVLGVLNGRGVTI